MRSFPVPYLDSLGLDEFLRAYPGIALRPSAGDVLRLVGELRFSAKPSGRPLIQDAFDLEICVPRTFPRELPVIYERGGRIPGNFHKYEDGNLCLGSRLRLLHLLHREPTLLGYAHRCLVPYLYGYSHKERFGSLPFGELEHGVESVIEDYCRLFGVSDPRVALALLELLGVKRRLANKAPCPCGSGRRVGRCHNRALNRLRPLLSPAEFKAERRRISGDEKILRASGHYHTKRK